MAGLNKIAKRIYAALPLKRELFVLIRRVGTPPKSIYKHLHFHGPFAVGSQKQSFKMVHYGYQLENELFWEGLQGWERTSLAVWSQLCRQAKTIVDIGANTGVYALLAKTENPSARVIAFEPVERVFEKLAKNCGLNGLAIQCVRKAVSDADGKATIFDVPSEHIYSVTVNKNLNSADVQTIKVEIETTRLDTFFKDAPGPDLIKIDVETHEPEVLAGMGDLLSHCQPVFLIEILNDDVAGRVEAILNPLRYCYFAIEENSGYTRVMGFAEKTTRNYIACPEPKLRTLGLDSSLETPIPNAAR